MKTLRSAFCIMVAVLLSACEGGDVKETLGLNRDAPDEFTVVSRPPLTVPPEFGLRPPRPGEAPLGAPAEEKAKQLLMGTAGAVMENQSAQGQGAAASLLKKAGAHEADSTIRAKLGEDERTPRDTSNAKTLVDQLTGADKQEPTVDAAKETERLRANKDAGKPLSEGEVPEAKPTSESLIDKIF